VHLDQKRSEVTRLLTFLLGFFYLQTNTRTCHLDSRRLGAKFRLLGPMDLCTTTCQLSRDPRCVILFHQQFPRSQMISSPVRYSVFDFHERSPWSQVILFLAGYSISDFHEQFLRSQVIFFLLVLQFLISNFVFRSVVTIPTLQCEYLDFHRIPWAFLAANRK
jgi:hypothetical protein